MLKNKPLRKLLAIILIFTLTFANFAFVTKSYAASFAETLFGKESDTGHKNIRFESYFGTEEEKQTSVISDVNNEELAINMNLDVNEAGYLKDAKIAIVEAEEGKGINFKLKENDEVDQEVDETNQELDEVTPEDLSSTEGEQGDVQEQVSSEDEKEYVQSVEDNTLFLKQINSSSDTVKIEVPIEYKNEKYVNEENLSKDFLVVLSGVYIDNEGKEFEISKEEKLNLSWTNEREIKVETSATKYIDFGAGIILQTVLKIDNSTDKKTLPVKKSQIVIDVPSFEDTYPSNVYVIANNTMATNGQNVGEVNFSEDNWSYDQENNKITINVNNEKKLVQINEFEDEFLQDSEKEIVEEERYCNSIGVDEYLITYTYRDLEIRDDEVSVNSNIEVNMNILSGIQEENIITNNQNYEYILQGKTGDIVSLNIENKTPEISKAYAYVNYGKNNRYETEFLSETVVNVSYTEILEGIIVEDTENLYIDKEGKSYENNDIYYKQISLSKENFVNLLGENGEIKVLDLNNNVIFTINNETEVNEEGNIVIPFETTYSKIKFETTKPIGEGNLVIGNVKAMNNSSIDKDTFVKLSSINTKSIIRANYTYVEGIVDVQNAEITTKLNDTETKANLVIDRDSLSTLEENRNVELRVELNNAVETSDVYGHSVFEIELPETVESFEITDTSLLYSEGLSITSVDINGRTIIVTLDGVQEGINSGVLTNGANIVINLNIKVNIFTPAKTDKINLRYNNSEATNYVNGGVEELNINYSAPLGLVAINSISDYNNSGSKVTSVRQGAKEDLIDIYSEVKTPVMEIIVMNNNKNTVSNFSILGRIPFKGVKNISTGIELGTTKDTKLITPIVGDERNNSQFTIYYSDNAEATKDLEEPSNNWIENPENFDNIKSYLIVPVDSNYEMQEADVLKFTYKYEIPENLPHNEKFYGTFLAYYTNNSEIAVTDEESIPDLVGLTTGNGPELSLEISSNKETVKEYEELQVKLITKNIGECKAEDINVEFPIPQFTSYLSSECENENVQINLNENKLNINAPSLEKGETFEVLIKLIANDNINTSNSENYSIKLNASVTAKDLNSILSAEEKEVQIMQAEFRIEQSNIYEIADYVYDVNEEITHRIDIMNLTDKTMNNVVVTEEIPNELSFVKATVRGYNDDGITTSDIAEGTYDENSKTVTWNIEKLEAQHSIQLHITVRTNELENNITKVTPKLIAMIKADGTDTYESQPKTISIGKPVLTIVQTTTTTDTYVKEGDKITYIFTVKNEGELVANHLNVKEIIPEGIIIEKVSYSIDGVPVTKTMNSNENVTITANLKPQQELVINVSAVAANLHGVQEKTVTNFATVTANNVGEVTSNSITHIIEPSLKNSTTMDFGNSSSGTSTPNKTNISKTYRLSGTAWLDSNSDGMRSSDEELLPGISVKLVDSESGIIKKTISTDSLGTYTFSGVENGSYLVIFDYDTVKYTVTTYQKDGVESSVNSDAITTKLEQDGKTRNGAITDVIKIENGSIAGIDIGLVLAETFDLKLDKTISKVTTQTPKPLTTTNNYDNTTFAKTEIASKYVSGSTVYVEYNITVSNVGDVKGYAKKIIDYLPEGMTFNSSIDSNSSWYTGSDGNLYTEALAEKELAPGESATVKLILTKQMTGENTGLVNNLAEIYDDYNIYGISDTNSTPANKAQGENDLGSADISILIKTGEVFIHISVIITSILLGSIVIFITYNKIVLSKRKGGV